MRLTFKTVVTWVLACLMFGGVVMRSATALDDTGKAEVYVRLTSETTVPGCTTLADLLRSHGLSEGRCAPARSAPHLFRLRWPSVDRSHLHEKLQALKEAEALQWFEIMGDPMQLQSRQVTWAPTATPAFHNTLMPAARGAADPDFVQQSTLRLRNLLKIYRPNSPVVVAVIDSGVNFDSPLLSELLWTNPLETPGNDVDDDGNGLVDDAHGWDFVDEAYDDWLDDSQQPDADPSDLLGHGTTVASIMAQSLGEDAARVIRIMPLRVASGSSGNGTVSPFSLAEAIRYATEHGAQVLNISLGSAQNYGVVQEAVNEALSRQVLVVAAAGNSGDQVLFPANLPGVMAVGALNASGEIWHGSARGERVDVYFPGTEMLHGLPVSFPSLSGSGTSFSAPLATAVATAFTALTGGDAACSSTREHLATARVGSQEASDWVNHLVDAFEQELQMTGDLADGWMVRKSTCGVEIGLAALLRRPG